MHAVLGMLSGLAGDLIPAVRKVEDEPGLTGEDDRGQF